MISSQAAISDLDRFAHVRHVGEGAVTEWWGSGIFFGAPVRRTYRCYGAIAIRFECGCYYGAAIDPRIWPVELNDGRETRACCEEHAQSITKEGDS